MKATKPAKPYKDFPLTAHPAGVWAKKIKGRLYYFGPWSDPDAALAKYRHQVDALQAGREPDPMPQDGQLTMLDLANEFLASKEKMVETGDLSRGMWFDYHRSCGRLLEITGKAKIVEHLKPRDFDDIRAKLASGVAKVTAANRIRLARILFKFAHDQDLVKTPLKLGQNFKQPDRAALRAERQAQPSKEFTAEELRSIIDAAGTPLKAMILLGVNAAFGNNDCATLPLSAIDFGGGWINFPRPKTHVERKAKLWPETIEALREAIAKRPTPKDDQFAGLVFVTKYGKPFVRLSDKGVNMDALAAQFAKVLGSLGLNGNRRAFYSLRRQFATVAGNSRDQIATDHVMGHSPASDDMSAVYRQSIADDRLTAVSEFVRAWLFPKPVKKPKAK
jgi:integrase